MQITYDMSDCMDLLFWNTLFMLNIIGSKQQFKFHNVHNSFGKEKIRHTVALTIGVTQQVFTFVVVKVTNVQLCVIASAETTADFNCIGVCTL